MLHFVGECNWLSIQIHNQTNVFN